MSTRCLLQGDFWTNLEGYLRLLKEKYEAIELAKYQARHAFATVKIMERTLSYPSDVLDALHTTEVVLQRRDQLGASSLEVFKAKDKLIMA